MKIDYILMRIMYMVFFISQNRIHKIKNWINNVWHAVWKDDFHKIGQMQNRKFVVFIWIYMNDLTSDAISVNQCENMAMKLFIVTMIVYNQLLMEFPRSIELNGSASFRT